ncbi:MAG: OmpA family protein [Ignavibacteriae bacterium]|nr:OmpA family protein [Ignavibacteriota bacterium]MCB9214320.1 OmpA family protein [Ignavibacteria bacterium]
MSTLHRYILSFSILFCISATTLLPQTAPDRISVGGEIDLTRYFGSFNSDFGFAGMFVARWNITHQFSLFARLGGGWLSDAISSDNILSHPEYFGLPSDTIYPTANGSINRDERNKISITNWVVAASWNFRTEERLVPYVTAGIGFITFDPRNKEQGVKLPNNQEGSLYTTTSLMIPIGVGAEYYLTPDLTLTAEGRLNLTLSDFLDDFDDGGLPDGYGTLGAGVSYYVFGKLDCDEDGLSDREEKQVGTDPCILDTDGDQLTDIEEIRTYGTNPLKPDTDGDGLGDAEELREYKTNPLKIDSDNDDLTDGNEVEVHRTNPLSADSDGDKLNDGDEVGRYNTDPLEPDTDKDGLNDGDEIERRTNPRDADSDDDELTDGEEVLTYRTNPLDTDTDNDELTDGQEIAIWKTDPLSPDTDNDRLADGAEVQTYKTNPNDPDSDDDGVIDGEDACPLVRGVPERNGCPAPPKVGTITDFPAVYFLKNTDQFDFSRQETTESLAKIMSYINQCPGLRVLIEGHASREGSDQRNLLLSEMRADRVKAWLIERGVSPEKVEGTIGYGSVRNAVPEPDPNSEEAKKMNPEELESIRRQNRRIAVRVARSCD